MGVTGFVFTTIGAVFLAVFSRLIADDIREWTPRATAWLIDMAVRRLPECYRERLAEEWRGHVNDVPGCASKLWVAVGYTIAARSIGRRNIINPLSIICNVIAHSFAKAVARFMMRGLRRDYIGAMPAMLLIVPDFERRLRESGAVEHGLRKVVLEGLRDQQSLRLIFQRLHGYRVGVVEAARSVNDICLEVNGADVASAVPPATSASVPTVVDVSGRTSPL
jgi:hypothetical protein